MEAEGAIKGLCFCVVVLSEKTDDAGHPEEAIPQHFGRVYRW